MATGAICVYNADLCHVSAFETSKFEKFDEGTSCCMLYAVVLIYLIVCLVCYTSNIQAKQQLLSKIL